MPTFIEENCTITHEGKEFTSGGACIIDCTDGYRRGVVYVKEGKKTSNVGMNWDQLPTVTDWHGNLIAVASLGRTYRGNYCKMRSVSFILDGVKFTGRYCPDWSEAVKVRSTVKVLSPWPRSQAS